MDLIKVFACDGSNAYILMGLLLGGFVGELVYASGRRIRIRRLWFLAGMSIGALAGGAVYWLLNGSCM